MLRSHKPHSYSEPVQRIGAPFRNHGFVAKRLANSLTKRPLSAQSRYALCIRLLEKDRSDSRLAPLIDLLETLTTDEQHYWIGTFYTLLLSNKKRRSQSAYFTPPEIAKHLLSMIEGEGIDLRKARLLDPAAGGAAFLSMVAGRMKDMGCAPQDILSRIRGIELDPMLARLARRLIAERLGLTTVPKATVRVGNALRLKLRGKFDVVLANPPYGRVYPHNAGSRRWKTVCHPGHINKYALFVDLCLERVSANGVVGLIIPSSFIAGPMYSRLRTSIRDRAAAKVLGCIECRDEFFFDVTQDTSLLILQRRSQPFNDGTQDLPVTFGRIDKRGRWNSSLPIILPRETKDGWTLPSQKSNPIGGATLADYMCSLKTGYFVWNREQERMSKTRERGRAVPLFWACNIRANVPALPRAKDGDGIDYVRFDTESQAIIRGRSILLQRTTNSKQPRRLIAACVDRGSFLTKGYVSENHTLVITPDNADVDLDLVCRLLNTSAVDRRYRQLSGTASISTLLLRNLDLPTPENIAAATADTADFEAAVERAYAMRISKREAS